MSSTLSSLLQRLWEQAKDCFLLTEAAVLLHSGKLLFKQCSAAEAWGRD
jgi:hypothetical protein